MPIIQYWHSAEIPGEVVEQMESFRTRNPAMRHRVFDEAAAERLIAQRVGEREAAAFRACAVPAMQADYFRYCAVLALGGVYADAAFSCLRSLEPLLPPPGQGLLFRREAPPRQLTTGFFLCGGPDHPFLRLAVDVATENVERRVADKIHVVTGPWVFQSLVALRRFGSLEAPPDFPLDPGMRRFSESVGHAVGDYGRIEEAFGRLRIEPLASALEWVARPEQKPAYKLDGSHWTDWHREGRSIFRQSSAT